MRSLYHQGFSCFQRMGNYEDCDSIVVHLAGIYRQSSCVGGKVSLSQTFIPLSYFGTLGTTTSVAKNSNHTNLTRHIDSQHPDAPNSLNTPTSLVSLFHFRVAGGGGRGDRPARSGGGRRDPGKRLQANFPTQWDFKTLISSLQWRHIGKALVRNEYRRTTSSKKRVGLGEGVKK